MRFAARRSRAGTRWPTCQARAMTLPAQRLRRPLAAIATPRLVVSGSMIAQSFRTEPAGGIRGQAIRDLAEDREGRSARPRGREARPNGSPLVQARRSIVRKSVGRRHRRRGSRIQRFIGHLLETSQFLQLLISLFPVGIVAIPDRFLNPLLLARGDDGSGCGRCSFDHGDDDVPSWRRYSIFRGLSYAPEDVKCGFGPVVPILPPLRPCACELIFDVVLRSAGRLRTAGVWGTRR